MGRGNKTVITVTKAMNDLTVGKASLAYQLEDIILLKHLLYQLRVKIVNPYKNSNRIFVVNRKMSLT